MIIRDTLALLAGQAQYAARVGINPKLFDYNGVQLPLRKTPELQRIRRSCYKGSYESYELSAIRQLLRPDDVVLELGSGCGVVSAFIGKKLSNSRNLHTFEPNPRMKRSIEFIAEANNITPIIVNAGVGVEDGEMEFYIDEDFLSSSVYDRGKSTEKVVVPVIALTSLLERIRPTVLVFDIEGAERDVLCVPIPEDVRVICGEMHPHIIGDRAVTKVIKHFIDYGFDFLTDCSQGRAVAFARPARSSMAK